MVNQETEDNPKTKILVITSIAVVVVAGVLIVSYCIYKRRIHKRRTNTVENNMEMHQEREDLELPMLELASIAKATNNFSLSNKLGEGGFGAVYQVKH
ncbi:hypothetical protein Patl1_04481 [Pistacia atlantica]|uniref:Uncharacterized protein n=1 Tax=Pistacia atlantica TaxID=434234 RepID=A0ACC1BWU2_9ROSI|nr:hypothetical protein Patl1_04481 [Pistacia atlantica]